MTVIDLAAYRRPTPLTGIALLVAGTSLFWFFVGAFIGATVALFAR